MITYLWIENQDKSQKKLLQGWQTVFNFFLISFLFTYILTTLRQDQSQLHAGEVARAVMRNVQQSLTLKDIVSEMILINE